MIAIQLPTKLSKMNYLNGYTKHHDVCVCVCVYLNTYVRIHIHKITHTYVADVQLPCHSLNKQISLLTSCTFLYICYAQFLCVSAIYSGHIQWVTSLDGRVQRIWQYVIEDWQTYYIYII